MALTEMIRVTFKWAMLSSLLSGLWTALDGKSHSEEADTLCDVDPGFITPLPCWIGGVPS